MKVYFTTLTLNLTTGSSVKSSITGVALSGNAPWGTL